MGRPPNAFKTLVLPLVRRQRWRNGVLHLGLVLCLSHLRFYVSRGGCAGKAARVGCWARKSILAAHTGTFMDGKVVPYPVARYAVFRINRGCSVTELGVDC